MERAPASGARAPSSRRRFLSVAAGGLLAGLAGCVVQGEDREGLRGEIRVDGSNTLLPHGAAVAEEFQWKHNRVRIPIRGSGTGAGFQRFCEGSTHIQNASRGIVDEPGAPGDEVGICEENDVSYTELEVVLDGIAIMIHPENDWCTELTTDELRRLWEPGSTVETWADLRPDDPSYPDEEIALYGRDTASGTFDFFTETINGEKGAIRSDYAASADTNVIVRGVRGDRHALGFGGFGFYQENRDELAVVPIDDGDGPVEPSRTSIEDGTYRPLSRPMLVYINDEELRRPEFRRYMEFFFEEIDERAAASDVVDEGETLTWTQWAAREVGFFAIPDETVERSRELLRERIEEGR